MKLVTFFDERSSSAKVGVLRADGGSLVDLATAAQVRDAQSPVEFSDMVSFLEGDARARKQAEEMADYVEQQQIADAIRTLGDVQLLAPVPRPNSIRDCMSFERHLVQATRTVVRWRCRPLAALDAWVEKVTGRGLLRVPKVWYERPVYYKGNPRSVVGPEADVNWPSYTEKFDFELEFGVFIGRQGKNIPKEQATDFIAGYTLFNDFSARDVQLREMQGRLGPAKGKDFDTGNALGPYLITPDEIVDPHALSMSVHVNGEPWSECTTADMFFAFEELIAYISQDETLYPGDFIGAGTLPGGCGLELDRWLAPGDVVELRCPELGVLRNRVKRNQP